MKYGDFLTQVAIEPFFGSLTLKENRRDSSLQESIMSQISMPEFYHEVSELEDIELI
jgi:hypothetical protein